MDTMENPTKEEVSGMTRAQSSLELLSQTAIEIESANSSPHPPASSSPARVTPASSVSESLVLPEMVSTHAGYPPHMNNVKDGLQLMPRPDGLATLMTMRGSEPALCLGNTTTIPEHIYPTGSFSSCGGLFQPTEHHETSWLRQQLAAKDTTIVALQTQVQNLTQEIRQLRQLPTGKISQIPLE